MAQIGPSQHRLHAGAKRERSRLESIAHLRKYPAVMATFTRLAQEYGPKDIQGFVGESSSDPASKDFKADYLVSRQAPGGPIEPIAAIHMDGSVLMLCDD